MISWAAVYPLLHSEAVEAARLRKSCGIGVLRRECVAAAFDGVVDRKPSGQAESLAVFDLIRVTWIARPRECVRVGRLSQRELGEGGVRGGLRGKLLEGSGLNDRREVGDIGGGSTKGDF